MDRSPDAPAPAPPWGLGRRIAFRLAFVYLILYDLPFPFFAFWNLSPEDSWYARIWHSTLPRVAREIFGVEAPPRANGSGDAAFHWVQVSCFLVLAAAATAAWSVLDRRRASYPRLEAGLRIYLRFALALVMVSYGALKVLPAQFPAPSLSRLVQPFGDASPMGLLWTLMGSSPAYGAFTGAAEVLGGLLLTARRTALLGALVSAGVLAHVVALNLCFDVPVKLFSLHLLAMALYLVAPDARRLADFFLGLRPVTPPSRRPLFARPGVERAFLALRTLAVAGITAHVLWTTQREVASRTARPPLYGLWTVEELAVDGRPEPPEAPGLRLARLIFEERNRAAVQFADGHVRRGGFLHDPAAGTLALRRPTEPDWRADFTLARPEPDVLVLDGTYEGRPLRARLRRAEPPIFPLRERGFHWVNEFPFNR